MFFCRWLTAKKNHARKKTGGRHQHRPRSEVTQGESGVDSIVCAADHYSGKTQRGLRMQPAAMLRFVCKTTALL